MRRQHNQSTTHPVAFILSVSRTGWIVAFSSRPHLRDCYCCCWCRTAPRHGSQRCCCYCYCSWLAIGQGNWCLRPATTSHPVLRARANRGRSQRLLTAASRSTQKSGWWWYPMNNGLCQQLLVRSVREATLMAIDVTNRNCQFPVLVVFRLLLAPLDVTWLMD